MAPFTKFGKKYDKNCDISDACCTDAGHDMPVNKERRHDFVWVVWTRPGKKQDNAEDDATFEGRREYTWNVDEMAPFAKFGKKYD